jgi:hypothetical protein
MPPPCVREHWGALVPSAYTLVFVLRALSFIFAVSKSAEVIYRYLRQIRQNIDSMNHETQQVVGGSQSIEHMIEQTSFDRWASLPYFTMEFSVFNSDKRSLHSRHCG